jgi:hypothetical protein
VGFFAVCPWLLLAWWKTAEAIHPARAV